MMCSFPLIFMDTKWFLIIQSSINRKCFCITNHCQHCREQTSVSEIHKRSHRWQYHRHLWGIFCISKSYYHGYYVAARSKSYSFYSQYYIFEAIIKNWDFLWLFSTSSVLPVLPPLLSGESQYRHRQSQRLTPTMSRIHECYHIFPRHFCRTRQTGFDRVRKYGTIPQCRSYAHPNIEL